jgi:hypothetical protein
VLFNLYQCIANLVSTAKGRTNFDLRDQLQLDENSSQQMQTFSPRRSSTGRISPFPATASGKQKRQNDTGYASSTSSGIPPTLLLLSLSCRLQPTEDSATSTLIPFHTPL